MFNIPHGKPTFPNKEFKNPKFLYILIEKNEYCMIFHEKIYDHIKIQNTLNFLFFNDKITNILIFPTFKVNNFHTRIPKF